jgi:hypothetical protein
MKKISILIKKLIKKIFQTIGVLFWVTLFLAVPICLKVKFLCYYTKRFPSANFFIIISIIILMMIATGLYLAACMVLNQYLYERRLTMIQSSPFLNKQDFMI